MIVFAMSIKLELAKMKDDVRRAIRFYSNPRRAYFMVLAGIAFYASFFRDTGIMQYALLPMINYMFIVVVATGLILAGIFFSNAWRKTNARGRMAVVPAITFVFSASLLINIYSMLDEATKADLVSPLGIVIFIVSLIHMFSLSNFSKSILNGVPPAVASSKKESSDPLVSEGNRLVKLGVPGIIFAFFSWVITLKGVTSESLQSIGISLFFTYWLYSLVCVEFEESENGVAAAVPGKKKAAR